MHASLHNKAITLKFDIKYFFSTILIIEIDFMFMFIVVYYNNNSNNRIKKNQPTQSTLK